MPGGTLYAARKARFAHKAAIFGDPYGPIAEFSICRRQIPRRERAAAAT